MASPPIARPITPMASAPPAPAHVDVMDGLRALAIAWVVWLHVWQISWLRLDVWVLGWQINFNHLAETGFHGVDLFFFVSGFCLFYPYARAKAEGRAGPALGHYAYRRAIKILPSYWLAIVLILAYAKPAWLWNPPELLWNLGSHLLFAQNLFPSTEAAINGVFWSLGVEVQFYVIFPLVAAAFLRWPLPTWAALCVAAGAWRQGVQAWWAQDLRFLMDQLPGYLDLFATGMLAAVAIVWLRAREAALARWAPAFTLAAVGALVALDQLARGLWASRIDNPTWPWGWQVDHRLHLALAFFVLAVASSRAAAGWRAWLAAPAMAFLSTISYNLYIWHQYLAREMAYRWHVPPAATADPHADPAWQLWFTVNAMAVAVAFAAAITYGFERPLLREGPRWLLGGWGRRKTEEVVPEDERRAA